MQLTLAFGAWEFSSAAEQARAQPSEGYVDRMVAAEQRHGRSDHGAASFDPGDVSCRWLLRTILGGASARPGQRAIGGARCGLARPESPQTTFAACYMIERLAPWYMSGGPAVTRTGILVARGSIGLRTS